MNRVAVLGTGAMGGRIARCLARAGYELTVFNRSREKTAPLAAMGAGVADTPAAAAEHADIVISMVTDDAASRAVWLDAATGAARAFTSGKVAIEMSTVTPAWVRELAQAVQAASGHFVDAPVIGSRPQADAGKLIVVVGGEAQTVQEVQHVFAAIAAVTHHVGAVGAGAAAKLAANFLFATQVAAVAELLVVLRRFGIDDRALAALFSGLPVTSPAALNALMLMQSGSYAPMFPIDLVEKDLRYHAKLAAEVAVQVPVTDAVRTVYADARAAGFGADNIHGVVQSYGASSRVAR